MSDLIQPACNVTAVRPVALRAGFFCIHVASIYRSHLLAENLNRKNIRRGQLGPACVVSGKYVDCQCVDGGAYGNLKKLVFQTVKCGVLASVLRSFTM